MNKSVQFPAQVPQPVTKPVAHVQQFFSIVPLLGRTLSYVKVIYNGELDRRELIATGAFENMISREFYKEINYTISIH